MSGAGRTRIKICGLTAPGDAATAAACGADLVGVVLAPSSREVSVGRAAEVLAAAPAGVERVGVFVDPELERVEVAVAACSLDWVQLSGREPPRLAREVSRLGVRVLKAVHVRGPEDVAAAAGYPADAFLLDAAPDDGRMGGTGRSFDWSDALDAPWPPGRIFVAGGLRADNVADAIRTLRPLGVDVCSGVERAPGVKDADRIAGFVAAARAAEEGR